MSRRKTYKITIEPQYVSRLIREFINWRISANEYSRQDNIITTRSTNVVDVVTETFMNVPSAYKIETV